MIVRSTRPFLSGQRSEGEEGGPTTHLSQERELQGDKQKHKQGNVSVRRHHLHGIVAQQHFQNMQEGVSLPSDALIFAAAAGKQDELVELEGGPR